jgi:Concanavalin A-like lectin/glucanases superfamily
MHLTTLLKPTLQLLMSGCFFLSCNHLFSQPVTGLVAYWPMDGNFTDSGPNAIAGTNTGSTPATNARGIAGGAMEFVNTGSNASQYASHAVNSNVNFSGSNDFTYDLLVYYSSPDRAGGFYDNNLNYYGSGVWAWYGNGFLQLQFNYKNASVGTTNGSLLLNTWTHITCSRASGVLSLYVNGVLNATTNEGVQSSSYSFPAKFGTQWFNASPYFNYNGLNGKMDEFRIYNRALTAEEISQLQCLHFPSAAAPLVNVAGDTTICEGTFVNLSSSLPAGNQWYKDNAVIPGATAQSIAVYNGGVYTVVNMQGGCMTLPSIPVTVSVAPGPALGNDTLASLLCPGATINLDTVLGTGGLNTTWSTPNPQNASAGSYQVVASNNQGCKDTALVVVLLDIAQWTGNISTNWDETGNWSNGAIPSEKTHVIIDSTVTNSCTINGGIRRVASIQLRNGAVLQLLNNSNLTITGSCNSLPGN